MIYIVEVPHQRKPFCWSAADENDAISKIWQTHIKMDNTPADNAPFGEWLRYNGLELSSQWVFMDAAAAIDGLKEICGHGAVEAIAALREELEATDELQVEVDDDR